MRRNLISLNADDEVQDAAASEPEEGLYAKQGSSQSTHRAATPLEQTRARHLWSLQSKDCKEDATLDESTLEISLSTVLEVHNKVLLAISSLSDTIETNVSALILFSIKDVGNLSLSATFQLSHPPDA